MGVLVLYGVALFVGASLLFVVQPMMGKMILPLLGGSPGVWSTCMLFFQATLLAGYAYAHLSTARLSASRQALLHVALLALGLAVMPLGVNAAWLSPSRLPVLQVLLLLSLSVGLPFFVVSATAPLLQRWFASTGHPAGRDPYFLYAASNLGSVVGLVSYPTIMEPMVPVRSGGWLSQTTLWTVGYLLLLVLTGLCALIVYRSAPAQGATWWEAGEGEPTPAESASVPVGQRLQWLVLAFAPSSLLLGVTTYMTTDVAAVPLLWVLPLSLYLLSFIIAFGRWSTRAQHVVVLASLPPVLAAILFMVWPSFRSRWLMFVHLGLFFVLALACHGKLALARPSPRHLTEFYLLVSVGGALGGLLNALVAPVVFRSLVEYPLMIVLACVLVRPWPKAAGASALRLALDLVLVLGVGTLAFVLFSHTVGLASLVGRVSEAWASKLTGDTLDVLTYGLPLVVVFVLRRRPLALAGSLLAVLLAAVIVDSRGSEAIRQTRNFFGILRVERYGDVTRLSHGTTLHGRQDRDPARREEPLSYYHRDGPIGQVFAELDERTGHREVAVVGLGTGTLAAYARRGDAMTFYEIDPDVRDIAFDPAYFTYVADARTRGAVIRLEMGDARLRLQAVRRERPRELYDLIVVDAFSSDAIPVHLLTREALQLYVALLKETGLLAIHVSNRYLSLAPVVANLAEEARLPDGLFQDKEPPTTLDADAAAWIVLARTAEALGDLTDRGSWTPLSDETDAQVGIWTDDFHNLLSVFKWR